MRKDMWFGELPKRWEKKRLGVVIIKRNEKNDPVKTGFILSLSASHGVKPYTERENQGNKAKTELSDYYIAFENDLLVNSMNVIIGSSGVSRWYGAISPVYYALYPRNNEVNIRYLEYIFKHNTFYQSLTGLGNGILEHRMRIPMSKLGNIEIPLPPRLEQDQIVRFLDWKVSQLNKLINVRKKQIGLLQEKRKRCIDDAIIDCKSDRQKFKNLFVLNKGLSITKDDLKAEGISCVNYGEIHSRYGFEVIPEIHLLKCVDESYLTTAPKSLLRYGDFIFADTSEDIAGSGNFTYLNSQIKTFAGYHTVIARAVKQLNYRYIAYYFDSSHFRTQIQSLVNGVKVYSITQSILKSTLIDLPSEIDQSIIVAYLDQKVSNIDKTIDKLSDEIKLFTEYRIRLISDVVTGKLDVRDVVVPEFEKVEDVVDTEFGSQNLEEDDGDE